MIVNTEPSETKEVLKVTATDFYVYGKKIPKYNLNKNHQELYEIFTSRNNNSEAIYSVEENWYLQFTVTENEKQYVVLELKENETRVFNKVIPDFNILDRDIQIYNAWCFFCKKVKELVWR